MAETSLPYSLPDADGLIRFTRSDGDSERLPGGSRGPPDEYALCSHESERSVKWRKFVGRAVAEELMGLKVGKHSKYMIADWPENYKLYGQKRKTDPDHTDTYLFGSKATQRFRSPKEFVPHAIFLLSQPSLDTQLCACKYCAHKTQSEVNSSMSSLRTRVSPNSKASTSSILRGVPKPGVRDATPADFAFPTVPTQVMNPQRDIDLRSPKRAGVPRQGEVVWCSIRPPLKGEQPGEEIHFWPGVVRMHNVGTYAMSHPDAAAAASSSLSPEAVDKGKANGDAPALVESWTVDLLGTEREAVIAHDDILPYLSYTPPPSLLTLMDAAELPESATFDTISSFVPFLPVPASQTESATPARTFENAWPAYALGVKTAAHLSSFWTLTDQYVHPVPPGNLDAAFASSGTSRRGSKFARFQGAFWGAERIWEDDLVRLDISFLSDPSNPASVALKPTDEVGGDYRGQLLRNMTPGAEHRGLFMKVHAFHFVQFLPSEGGVPAKQCWMAGMVYETVPMEVPATEESGASVLATTENGSAVLTTTENGAAVPVTTENGAADATAGKKGKGKEREEEREVEAAAAAIAARLSSPDRSTTPTQQNPNPGGSSPNKSPSRRRHPVLSAPVLPPSSDASSSAESPDALLPAAPLGFAFRSVLPLNAHLYVNIQQLAGRYYPTLCTSAVLLASFGGQSNGRGLLGGLSLNGYIPAMITRAACVEYVRDRKAGVVRAEMIAKKAWGEKWGLEDAEGEKEVVTGGDRDGDVDMDAA